MNDMADMVHMTEVDALRTYIPPKAAAAYRLKHPNARLKQIGLVLAESVLEERDGRLAIFRMPDGSGRFVVELRPKGRPALKTVIWKEGRT